MIKNRRNTVMIYRHQKLFIGNMNIIYLVTGQLTNSKGLYDRNIYIKSISIKKHTYVYMFAIMLCLLIFLIKLIYSNSASILGLLGNYLKLTCLSTVNKIINAIYFMNFRNHNLCSKVPTTIN